MEISFGNITESEIEKAEILAENAANKKVGTMQTLLGNFDEKKGSMVSKGDIMGIRHSMRLESSQQQLQSGDRQALMVESSCIFCLIWTIGILYKPESRRTFNKFLIDKVRGYYKGHSVHLNEISPPGFFLSHFGQKAPSNAGISSTLGVFDYCFDVSAQKWTLWKTFTLPEYQEISSDFLGIRFSTKELLKFNPLLKKTSQGKSFTDLGASRIQLPALNDQIFIETETSKKVLYFLDYMIAYKKPLFLVSEYENGKTTIVNHKLKTLLEYNTYKTFSFSLTPFTTKEQVNLF